THYKPKERRLPTSTCSFRKWSPETEQTLRDCFEDTDWDVLQGLHSGNIEEVVDRTTDYINFCMDVVVPACALELGDPLQRIFNLSLEHERVPRWCKTSCIIPVPKKPHPGEVNDLHESP
ncbi:hypothetical protein QTP70_032095, partial [Hemibagrus guttatus]